MAWPIGLASSRSISFATGSKTIKAFRWPLQPREPHSHGANRSRTDVYQTWTSAQPAARHDWTFVGHRVGSTAIASSGAVVEAVKSVVELELGKPLEEIFLFFSEKPIASASIGQVHLAKLLDGTEVVVKVQHVNIQATVREDLEVMAGLATMAEHLPELAAWNRERWSNNSRSPCDANEFCPRAANLQLFAGQLHGYKEVCIPVPFRSSVRSGVLTMELLNGRDVSEFSKEAGITEEARQHLAKLAAEVYVEMIFMLGVYHADPHPGNVLVMHDGNLGLLDFGMCGRIDDRLRENIEEMLMAVLSRDASY